jgi:phenylpyruvate tautomerase PptA (4-oxalocrotonate tautomerase family)
MPLWRVFAHPTTFSVEQRASFAKAVTNLYVSRGLPAFYVNVIFLDVTENQVWIGGEPKKNFVRIVIEQIARTMPNPDTEKGRTHRKGWMDEINNVKAQRIPSSV